MRTSWHSHRALSNRSLTSCRTSRRNPIINSFMYIPVNCAIIAQVYKDIRQSRELMPKTMTQLYMTLTLVLIRRHMIGSGIWDELSRMPGNIKGLSEELLVNLKRVSELAYQGLFKKDIQLEFTDSDVGEGFEHLGLLIEAKEMYVCMGARTSYSFLHLSIQEFLAAWYVSCHPALIEKAASLMFVGSDVRPHLEAFGLFLTGMVGCDKLQVETFHDKNYALKCLYEAQNPNNLNLLDYSLNLTNPLDMHVFGYTLSHAAIQWELTTSIPFDALLSSLADHGGKILGSIRILNLYLEPNCTSSKLKDLPKSLLHSIVKIVFGVHNASIPAAVAGIAAVRTSLQKVYFDLHGPCDEDYLLYRALRSFSNLRELEVHFYCMTTKGMRELYTSIANNITLERIALKRYKSRWNCKFDHRSYQPLVEAALSSPAVKSLTVDSLPFQTLNNIVATNASHLEITVQPDYSTTTATRLFDCLCSIAGLCKLPSVRSLRLFLHFQMISQSPPEGVRVPVGLFCNFIAVLNNSLHCNPSIEKLGESIRIYCPIQQSTLSRALRKDPDTLQLNLLRKTKSLCDLSTLDSYWSLGKPPQRSRSCPDLLEMQSLHTIHPLLYDFLLDTGYNDFYYRGGAAKQLHPPGVKFLAYRRGFNHFIF